MKDLGVSAAARQRGQFSVVMDLKKEIGPGLLADMCRQLGLRT